MNQDRLILFDIDGTLIDSAGAGRQSFERAFEQVFRVDSIAARTEQVRFAGMTDLKIIDALAAALEIDSTTLDRRRDELERCYLDELRGALARPSAGRRRLPGVIELLDNLTLRSDVWLGLVTGNIEPAARIKLGPFNLNRFFPAGGFGSDHRERAELARLAHMRMSSLTARAFPAERVWVVGDTEHDVGCARANGFRAIAVDSGWTPRSRLEAARPDLLVSDLTDIERLLISLGLG